MYATERRWGPISIAIAVAVGLVVGGIVLSAALWMLSMVAGIVWFVIRMGLLVGLAAAVVYAFRFFFSDHSHA
ncbi:MAG: hypothetical protein ACYDH6_14405 [Acidimicrobiales bacterium]